MSDPEPILAGRYRLQTRLGAGAQAEVWKAWDEELGVSRALKVLLDVPRGRESLRTRMLSEARAMARLDHPNILRVLDIDRDGDTDFLVMELMSGSLEDLLEEGPLPPGQAVDYGIQVLSALEAAHRKGIVHRDVKPQNVLLSESGVAKLADFGIAQLHDLRTTRTGVGMGSMAFMAPEQAIDAKNAGPPADVHALGTSLFFMVTGEFAMGLCLEPLDSSRWKGVPDTLKDVIYRAVRPMPEERYQTAAEMAEALGAIRDELGGLPAQDRVVERLPQPADVFTGSAEQARAAARSALPPMPTAPSPEAVRTALTLVAEEEVAAGTAPGPTLLPDPDAPPDVASASPVAPAAVEEYEPIGPVRLVVGSLLVVVGAVGLMVTVGGTLWGLLAPEPKATEPVAVEPAPSAPTPEPTPPAPTPEPTTTASRPTAPEPTAPEPAATAKPTATPKPKRRPGHDYAAEPAPFGVWTAPIGTDRLTLRIHPSGQQTATVRGDGSLPGAFQRARATGTWDPATRKLVVEVGGGTVDVVLQPGLDRFSGRWEREGSIRTVIGRRK